jgi:predicted Zn-dependent protease
MHGKVLGAVHDRVPMVTADEQRALQLENAKADAQFWDRMADMHAGTAADHKGLAARAERTAAEGEVERAKPQSMRRGPRNGSNGSSAARMSRAGSANSKSTSVPS